VDQRRRHDPMRAILVAWLPKRLDSFGIYRRLLAPSEIVCRRVWRSI
jgi:hypothetical protein